MDVSVREGCDRVGHAPFGAFGSSVLGGFASRGAWRLRLEVPGGFASRVLGRFASNVLGGFGSSVLGGYASRVLGGCASRVLGGFAARVLGGFAARVLGGFAARVLHEASTLGYFSRQAR